MTVGKLAMALGLSQPGAVRLVDRLAGEGLVARGKAAADARAVALRLTAGGFRPAGRDPPRARRPASAPCHRGPDRRRSAARLEGLLRKLLAGMTTDLARSYALCRLCDQDRVPGALGCPVEAACARFAEPMTALAAGNRLPTCTMTAGDFQLAQPLLLPRLGAVLADRAPGRDRAWRRTGVPAWQIGVLGAVPWLVLVAAVPFAPAAAAALGAMRAYRLGLWARPGRGRGLRRRQYRPASWAFGYALCGLSLALKWVVANSLVAALAPPGRRGHRVGLFETLVGASMAVGRGGAPRRRHGGCWHPTSSASPSPRRPSCRPCG